MTVDLSAIPEILSGKTVTPDDRQYRLLRSTYTTVSSPALIILPEDADQVAAALLHARGTGLPLSIRSGGHGLSGRSSNDHGIVIDLSALNTVRVIDQEKRLVRIGPGARWTEVAQALAPYGWVISSGDHGNVGVGGLATAGGIGWLARSYGLTIDHVRAVEMVLADGTQVRADADHEPELFWAVRGAGAEVGIVVAFEIEAAAIANVGVAQLAMEIDRGGASLGRWADYMREAPRELSTMLTLFADGHSLVAQTTAVVASDDVEFIRRAVEPLLDTGMRLLGQQAQVAPYTLLMPTGHLHPNVAQQPVTTTSGFLPTFTTTSARAVMDAVVHPAGPLVQLRSLGGAINDVDSAETAYPHRHQEILAVVSIFPPGGGAELDRAWSLVAPHTDGSYQNFESRPDAQSHARAFPGETGRRIAELRARFDPDGVFRPPVSAG